MRLPKYKQPMLDIYNSTDFSGLTNEEKECYDKVFFDALKNSYSMVPSDCIPYYQTRKDVIKSLADKGFVTYFCGLKNLLMPKIIADVLDERMKQRRLRRKA